MEERRLPRPPVGFLLSVLACVVGASLAAPATARAGACPFSDYNRFVLQGNLSVVGVPVENSSVKVEATGVAIMATRNTTRRTSKVCDPLLFEVTSHGWSVDAPPGQSATIANGGTLSPTVNLGGQGRYRAVLTACPLRCRLRARGGRTRRVGPFVRSVNIDVGMVDAPPPETEVKEPPVNPESAFQDPSGQSPTPGLVPPLRAAKCGLGGGFSFPEWVTAQRFEGPGSYRLGEGLVKGSKVSEEDNLLNHDSNDFEWTVKPDPPYQSLVHGRDDFYLKTEWEGNSIPDLVRPTAGWRGFSGDRTSVYGFWILDCGHPPFKTEIHPPIGVVTQRPRPVHIPPSYRPPPPDAQVPDQQRDARFPNGFGSNIFVPGVVADIWFNRNSGRNGDCNISSSLHQPLPRVPGECLANPHPIGRKFSFNVYLPRSPQQVAKGLGRSEPRDVPLFIGTEKFSSGGGGPDPTWKSVPDGKGGIYLRGTVDLTGFKEGKYGRRVSIAWAYPSPDNWGASRWRVSLNRLTVHDDAEYFDADYGDWRFFFNTNNRDQEWTKLFGCDGCVHDGGKYDLNVSTGVTHGRNGTKPKKAQDIGPDPVVFPGQPILVRTSGYDDELWGQDVGTVQEAVPQVADTYPPRLSSGTDAKGSYSLSFTISPVGSVGSATLTPEAQRLYNDYVGPTGARCGPGAPAPGGALPPECVPSRQESPTLGKRVVPLKRLPGYESETEREEGPGGTALFEISAKTLRRAFKALPRRARPGLLKEIRNLHVPKGLLADYEPLFRKFEQALGPRLARRAVPRAIRKAAKRVRRQRAQERRRRLARRRHRRRRRQGRSFSRGTISAPVPFVSVPRAFSFWDP